MQITAQNNNQNFKGLHINRGLKKKFDERFILFNPSIRKCAEKYEVLVKKHKNVKVSTSQADKFIQGLYTSLVAVTGMTASVFASMAGLADSIIGPVLITGIPTGLSILGFHLYNKRRSIPEYSIQAGKRIVPEKFGRMKLAGSKSEEHIVKNLDDIGKITGLAGEIEKNDYNKFLDILEKYENHDLGSIRTFTEILNDPAVKENFPDGEIFNYKINDEDSLLTRFFDIVPMEDNKKEYNEVIKKMESMKKIDYNQRDSYGISIPEKILNSENFETLALVKNTEFPYSRELDYVYNNISNKIFKKKAELLLNIKFTNPIEAVKIESAEALDIAIKELDSPFCKRDKIIKEMLDNAGDGEFRLKVLIPKLYGRKDDSNES